LLATLMPDHYKVQRVQARITEIEHTLEIEKVALLKRSQSDYEEALRKEKMLSGAYTSQTHAVSAQSDKASQYAMLKRDVDTEQTLYQTLLQRSNEAALIALAPTSSIRVVDEASPSRVPVSPVPASDIPVWSLAGGGLGYGLILLREFARRKKRTKLFDAPGHSQNVLGVPELGVIPSTQIFHPKKKMPFATFSRNTQPMLEMQELATSNKNGDSVTGSWQNDRSSMLSESFRQTLVSLLRTKPQGHSPVYVITSAGPGEGKTTLCVNLARAMAETGERVLIVDADLRRPSVHNLLGSSDRVGLSDILAGHSEIEDVALASYIQSTYVENLSVITHGLTKVETPALLFFSPRVGLLVSLLQSKFDCILFDTAPALPFPDARLWGKHSDGVVMVVRSGVTTREGASAACERFLNDGISVLGTILNDWTPSREASAGYQYGYYASSGQKRP
jgi:polysaccharide biosynthesis transport protein